MIFRLEVKKINNEKGERGIKIEEFDDRYPLSVMISGAFTRKTAWFVILERKP